MNTHPNMVDAPRSASSGLSQLLLNHRSLGFVLALWFGGSVLLDFVVMPALYVTGMMDATNFASAGESLFLTFNNLEIILGAIALAAVFAHRQEPDMEAHRSLGGVGLPLAILGIAFVYRYWLTPQMAGMGASLDLLNPDIAMSADMMTMHASYWLLEGLKLTGVAVLLNRCFRLPI